MSSKAINDDPMLKIVLCEEDDLPEGPGDGPSKRLDKHDMRTHSSRLANVRKQNGVRSANYVLASNPYQRKGNCANCQSMQNAKNNVSPFTQKIMSAKLLRFKQMQNQISEMSLKINELMSENKILKTLQRRQDNALKKYEGSKEQLPQLIKNHNEEVRVINQKFKQLKAAHRELENKLKQKDSELTNLREQHSHLLQLSRDKQLFERDKLAKKLASLELYSKEQNEKIITLQRKLELQEKNFKHQLQLEMQKHRDTQSQLLNVRQMNALRSKEGQEKARSPRKIVGLGNYDSFGNRSRASLPSPARQVAVEGQRTTMSEMATKTSYSSGTINKDREEDSDSVQEEETNIKVSVKRSNLVRRNPARSQGLPKESPRRKVSVSAPNTTEGSESKTSTNLPGRVSVSSNQSEDVPNGPNLPKNMAAELQDDVRQTVESPRFNHYRGGISIPSDLTIGNAARMRAAAAIPSSEESATSDDDETDLRAPPVTETADSDVDDATPKNSLRARAEEDIDKIITKACDDMLANDVEHDSIMNGIGNFSLSEEISQLKGLSWEELNKQIKPMRDEMAKKIENADYSLDPNEKNHLLKALNLIDEENQPAANYVPSEPEKRQSVRQMFAQNRKKVDLMKSLFGSDADPIPVSDGIN